MCLSCGCVPAGTGTPEDDHGDARHLTMLILQGAADAAGIDVGTAAANILASLGATDDDGVEKAAAVGPLLKAEPAQRFTLMLAWPALKPDVAKAADGRRDYARPEVIEQTAWAWMAKSRAVGLFHADGDETVGSGTVVESYVYRGPDWLVKAADGSEQLIKAGDWLIGCIWTERAWALVQRGMINGMSPQGTAQRRPADPSVVFDRG